MRARQEDLPAASRLQGGGKKNKTRGGKFLRGLRKFFQVISCKLQCSRLRWEARTGNFERLVCSASWPGAGACPAPLQFLPPSAFHTVFTPVHLSPYTGLRQPACARPPPPPPLPELHRPQIRPSLLCSVLSSLISKLYLLILGMPETPPPAPALS